MRAQNGFRPGGTARGLGDAAGRGGHDMCDYIMGPVMLTFDERRFELRRPDDLALAFDCLPALSASDNGLNDVAGTRRTGGGKGVRNILCGGNSDMLSKCGLARV